MVTRMKICYASVLERGWLTFRGVVGIGIGCRIPADCCRRPVASRFGLLFGSLDAKCQVRSSMAT